MIETTDEKLIKKQVEPSEPTSVVNSNLPATNPVVKKSVILLIGLIATIAFCLSLYVIYHLKQLQTRQTDFNQSIQTSNTEQRQRTQQLVDDFNHQQEKINAQLETTNALVQKTLHQQSSNNQDWLLQKAHYYLELAKIDEHWGNNKASTVALLSEADALIKEAPNPSRFFTTRQAIAKEISELNAQAELDVTGILSKLDAAQDLVSRLPLKQSINHLNAAPELTTTTDSSWRSHLNKSFNELKKLVVIRRNDDTINPLISPVHETLLRDSLKIDLQKAQWAIIQNNPTIYHASLAQALDIVVLTFDVKAPDTEALVKQLNELQTVTFKQPHHIVNNSLNELNQALQVDSAITTPVKGESHD